MPNEVKTPESTQPQSELAEDLQAILVNHYQQTRESIREIVEYCSEMRQIIEHPKTDDTVKRQANSNVENIMRLFNPLLNVKNVIGEQLDSEVREAIDKSAEPLFLHPSDLSD